MLQFKTLNFRKVIGRKSRWSYLDGKNVEQWLCKYIEAKFTILLKEDNDACVWSWSKHYEAIFKINPMLIKLSLRNSSTFILER